MPFIIKAEMMVDKDTSEAMAQKSNHIVFVRCDMSEGYKDMLSYGLAGRWC